MYNLGMFDFMIIKDYPSQEILDKVKESSKIVNKIGELIKQLNNIGFIEAELTIIKKRKI